MSGHAKERFPRFRRYWPAVVVLVAGLAVTAGVSWRLHREALALDRERMAIRIEEFTDQLDGRLEKTEQFLQQLQDYLMLTGEDRSRVLDEWLNRRGPAHNFSWVYGIVVATNRHASRWREVMPGSPKQWDQADWTRFSELASTQRLDCVPALSFPFKQRSRQSFSFLVDYGLQALLSDSSRLTLAVSGTLPRLTSHQPVVLGAQSNIVRGVAFLTPVFRDGMESLLSRLNPSNPSNNPRRPAVRWLHLDSVIVAPINFRTLERAVWDGRVADLGVEIFSSTNQTAETWLNVSGAGPYAADLRFKPYLSRRAPWRMLGHDFSLYFHTTPLFEAQSPRRLARTIALAGGCVTLLAAGLAGVSLRARTRQERLTVEIIEARDALAGAEKERVKLGHDLHDGAIQSLYAIQLGLSRTAESVAGTLPESSRVLNQTRERVDEVIAELRRFLLAREAAAESVEPVGLDRVLAAMVERLQSTTAAAIQFEAQPGAAARLSTVQAVHLTQLARGALANCLRHAGARRIDVTLGGDAESVRLEIADDGAGFNPGQPVKGGIGLQTMQRRAADAGGTLTVHSQAGQGTRIVVSLPARRVESAAAVPAVS